MNTYNGRCNRSSDVGARLIPIHQGFADGVHSHGVGTAADGIEVFDQVLVVRAEGSIPLAGIEGVHHEPFRVGGPGKIDNLLINIVPVALHHPVIVR